MNKITINHGSFKVNEVELEHGSLTVGRAADNDIQLDDSAVSSHHAKLVTFFNVTYIEDLNSTNGTLVNGRQVKKYTLHTGDIVLLGKHQLLFQGTRVPDKAAKSDATMIMSQNDRADALANAVDNAAKPAEPIRQSIGKPDFRLHTKDAESTSAKTSAEKFPRFSAHADDSHLGLFENVIAHSNKLTDLAPETAAETASENVSMMASAPSTNEPVGRMIEPETSGEFLPEPESNIPFDFDAASKSSFAANLRVDNDESLLIPAFAKKNRQEPTPFQARSADHPVDTRVVGFKPNQTQHLNKPPARTQNPGSAPASEVKPAKKVLEDPSVSQGEVPETGFSVGINESNRIHQYQQRVQSLTDIPAVGDRTLLKQIITGDREFSPNRNKFEIIQIVLGVVIFIIIALIAIASL